MSTSLKSAFDQLGITSGEPQVTLAEGKTRFAIEAQFSGLAEPPGRLPIRLALWLVLKEPQARRCLKPRPWSVPDLSAPLL